MQKTKAEGGEGRTRKEELPNHPVARLLQSPNGWQDRVPVAIVSETEAPKAPQGERTEEKPRGTARQARIEIRCKGGRVLKVESGIDPAVLQALICSVEAA
jgi:hypothetical protein